MVRSLSSTCCSLTLVLASLVAACGDDDDGPSIDAAAAADSAPGADAPTDAAPPDAPGLNTAACPATYGPSAVTNMLSVSDTVDDAFDLDGDGDKDNELSLIAQLINGTIAEDLADGSLRLVSDLRDVDDATLTTDPALRLSLLVAADSDSPADAADDFSHMEAFYFRHASVDPVSCEPNAVMDMALVGGVASGSEDVITIPISGIGLVDLGKAHAELTIVPDASGTGFECTLGRLGGAVPPCPLQGSTGPLGQNNLHALTGFLALQPDIDMDGDGLETVQSDTNGINGCTDGDGTVIAGPTCGCDPRMVDGFSVLLRFTDVGATLLGPSPTP
jgi:hypothetical protein